MTEIDKSKNRYFRWLLEQVDYKGMKDRDGDYLYLLKYLFEREFYWDVPHDNNRVADGIQLRMEAKQFDYDLGPCSVLEMLVALSRRIDSEIMPYEESPSYWFWMMLDNLGACKYDNEHYDKESVNYIVSLMMFRGYKDTGKGGLFPLKHPKSDQRKVEIWYQMQSYFLENYGI